MTDEARERLAEGERLLDAGDLRGAEAILGPLTGHPDRDLSGAAWLMVGQARYRADDEPAAMIAWQRAAATDGSAGWRGWKAVAEQRVRDGALDEAVEAYREADRRAPPAERGAIANRIAWLLKETGHDFAARRQFNRARGAYATYVPYVTWAILAINIGVYLLDMLLAGSTNLFGFSGGPLVDAGAVYAPLVAQGEWYRLIAAAFLHLGLLHIAFNMYALYLFGPIVEQLYGRVEYAILYLLCALGGSVLTILLAPNQAAAGASGAIFGLFGLAFVVSRRHHAALGREARYLFSQAGSVLVLNLVITFIIPGISWTGHVGGLLIGGAIGFLLPPTGVATLASMWRTPAGDQLNRSMPLALRAVVYAGVALVLAAGSWYAVLRT
ncbi:MAG TPA: rhomboid family intramembrane serine protease [Solirubrobacter sp.]|nr:rhomboid family intramembrane serine protease [Solirubrobacter sp.]